MWLLRRNNLRYRTVNDIRIVAGAPRGVEIVAVHIAHSDTRSLRLHLNWRVNRGLRIEPTLPVNRGFRLLQNQVLEQIVLVDRFIVIVPQTVLVVVNQAQNIRRNQENIVKHKIVLEIVHIYPVVL